MIHCTELDSAWAMTKARIEKLSQASVRTEIAKILMEVQPLTGPTGLVFYFNSKQETVDWVNEGF